MDILSQRWKGLGAVPRIDLAELPTPVARLEAIDAPYPGELWVKRDDLTSPRYGGNKVRKLEFLLGEALASNRDTLITSGAAGSHHALATSRFASELHLDVHAVLLPQGYSVHVEENLRALVASGATVVPASGATVVSTLGALAARLRLRGRRPYVIPPGGSNVAGILGTVEAGVELARQIEAAKLPEPDEVVVALGSGGTAVGLSIGLAAAGITSRIVAVRVVPRAVANRPLLRRAVHKTVRHLRKLDNRFPDVATVACDQIDIDGEEYGGGYGAPTSPARSAIKIARDRAGLTLDLTYTGKAFASALRRVRAANRRVLFVHTLSSVPLEDAALAGPPLQPSIRRLMRHAPA